MLTTKQASYQAVDSMQTVLLELCRATYKVLLVSLEIAILSIHLIANLCSYKGKKISNFK